MRITVLGASGYVGGRLVARLIDAHHRVTLVARNPALLRDRFPEATVLSGNVLEYETLRPALRDADAVYYLAALADRAGRRGEPESLRGARNVARAAATEGVRRMIVLGRLGEKPGERWGRPASQAVDAELARGGLAVTEFRAAVIIGSGSASFEIIRQFAERLPVLVAPRWMKTKCQPIGIRDVLSYLIEALEHPEISGVVEIGGPDVLSFREMIRAYARVRGLRRFVLGVPTRAERLSSWSLGLVSPVPSHRARPLVERLRSELVVRDARPASAFATRPACFDEVVTRALDRLARNEVESTWFDAYSTSGRQRAISPLQSQEGMFIDRRRYNVDAPPERVFKAIEQLGGRRGWPFANSLWRLRGLLDRLVGGVGMRFGRRDPLRLRVGDALDFWRVESIRRPQLLRLRAEMRMPGRAWLQFEVEPTPRGSRLIQTAFFEPRGLGGAAYWYLLLPVHRVIFRGMVAALAANATLRSPTRPRRAEPPGRRAHRVRRWRRAR